MDHDDISLPERLEKQVQFLDANPMVGVVGCWVEIFPNYAVNKYPEYNKQIVQSLMLGECIIAHTGAMIRRSVLSNIKYEKEYSPAEDYRLWCRLIGKTEFYNIQEVLIKYRWYEENTSKHQLNKMLEKAKKIVALIRQKEHPDIWLDMCNNEPHIIRMRLFGTLYLGKFTQKGNMKKGILKYLPFITIKAKFKKN